MLRQQQSYLLSPFLTIPPPCFIKDIMFDLFLFLSMQTVTLLPSSFSEDCSVLAGTKLLVLTGMSGRQQPANFHTFRAVFYLQEDKFSYKKKIREIHSLKRIQHNSTVKNQLFRKPLPSLLQAKKVLETNKNG